MFIIIIITASFTDKLYYDIFLGMASGYKLGIFYKISSSLIGIIF